MTGEISVVEDDAVPESSSRQLVAATIVSSAAVATPATDVKPPADNLLLFLYIGIAISAVVLVSLFAVGFAFRKLRAERKSKDLATEAFLNVYRWTKVVLVEKTAGSDAAAVISDPKVHIEKKKYQMSEEGVEDCDTEYQFPFDPKWELDRERLRIHSMLGEGQFGRVMYATLDCGEGGGGAQAPVAVKESWTKLFHANS